MGLSPPRLIWCLVRLVAVLYGEIAGRFISSIPSIISLMPQPVFSVTNAIAPDGAIPIRICVECMDVNIDQQRR